MEIKEDVLALIQDEDSDLPVLSAVVDKILSVAEDPDASAEDLANVISYDQGMTHKLLKLANSIYYAQRTKVDSVKRAISVIGFDEIIGISLGMKVFSSFQNTSAMSQEIERLWIHGISVAIASKQMAKHAGPKLADHIFIPGLLHDMGKSIFALYFEKEYPKAIHLAVEKKVPLYKAERVVFGLNHAQLSMLLMERWNFPDSIRIPCGCHHHHNPESVSPEYYQAALYINLADYISHRAGMGKCAYPTPIIIQHSPETLGISPGVLKLTIDFLRRKEYEIKEFYNILSDG